jgi:hypothetical protein
MGRDVRAIIFANAPGDRDACLYFVFFIRPIKLEESWCFSDVVIDTRKRVPRGITSSYLFGRVVERLGLDSRAPILRWVTGRSKRRRLGTLEADTEIC